MKRKLSLVALDLDGTLFNQESRISKTDQDTIKEITSSGIEAAIATGRPYAGLPVELLSSIGIRYAITANGAAIYRLPEKECLFSSCMPPKLVFPLLEKLQKKSIHMDAFIDGDGFSQKSCERNLYRLDMPESIRDYIRSTRTFTDDLAEYIKDGQLDVQKVTLNFYPLPDGTFESREAVKQLLSSCPQITFLSGGYHNLEFTKTGTTKGAGLLFLCEHLGIHPSETMACGDTQNDIEILKTASIGVAMANAREDVKEIADYITLSNEESGVSHAIRRFL